MNQELESSAQSDVEFTQSMDAMNWAEAFCKRFKIWSDDGVDTDSEAIGLMLGWFSNAIMRGYDDGYQAGLAAREEWQPIEKD